MKPDRLPEIRKPMITGIFLFDAVALAIVAFSLKMSFRAMAGIFIGLPVLILNFLLLEKMVVRFAGRDVISAVSIFFFRLGLYTLAIVLCIKISAAALVCFGISVLGVPAGALLYHFSSKE